MPTADGWYMRTISGRTTGLPAAVSRLALSTLSCPYRLAIAIRNYYYDTSGQVTRPPVPVISVGNLTTGGTGKTPFVAGLFNRLAGMSRRPAILIRGYHAARGGLADEVRELVDLTGCDRIVQNPDRLAAAEEAICRFAPDVLLLDDGFQHRRIGRHLDIVLVDATNPFGHGHLLPRGLLREPPTALRRADLIVLTRCDQVDSEHLDLLRQQIAKHAPEKPLMQARHRPVAWVGLDGEVLALPSAEPRRVVCFAGVANPGGFVATVTDLGTEVVARRWWPDHHEYSPPDLTELVELARQHQAEAFVTTGKDLVKLRVMRDHCPQPLWALRIEIELRPPGDTILTDLLAGVLDAASLP